MTSDHWPAAVFSGDGIYRYYLSRAWSDVGAHIAFIGLNPSTADAVHDDRTISRCISFAKEWGGSRLSMVNLFALRSTNPIALSRVQDPVGPETDVWLDRVVQAADIVVACWGNHGVLHGRGQTIAQRFDGKLVALAINGSGAPKHPLYVRSGTCLMPYSPFAT